VGWVVAVVLTLFTTSLLAQRRPAQPAAPIPATLDVCMTGAALRPTRANGDPWQPFGKKETPELAKKVVVVMGALAKLASLSSPQAAVAGILAELFAPAVLTSVTKPRVYGTMELAPNGAFTGEPKNVRQIASSSAPVADFQPGFGTGLCFKDVALTSDARLRVNLRNKHTVVQDDDIATVMVKAESLVAIYRAGDVHHVYVGSQDRGQLLTVSLTVTKGASSAR
jgi:hypothetical protein